GNATPHWYPFLYNGTTGANILSDRIELYFVDGGRGDGDATANGVIVDPGAPVIDQRPHPWQHPLAAVDVNDDGSVSPLDALLIVNELNLRGSHALSTLPVAPDLPPGYFDVSGDGAVSPLDALQVINDLNANGARSLSVAPTAEGESAAVVTGFVPWIQAETTSVRSRVDTDTKRGGQATLAPRTPPQTNQPLRSGLREQVPAVGLREADEIFDDWQELESLLDILAQPMPNCGGGNL
ncbi:MAG: dockerin type I domain-containing protein, partial [Planctomycetota bacterium]